MRKLFVLFLIVIPACTGADVALAHKITCDAAQAVCLLCSATSTSGSETPSSP